MGHPVDFHKMHVRLDEDKLGEQMTMLGKSNDNPFTGGSNGK